MSLWGATVITNLVSAIPWIGQDIVEFIWGGFSVNNATLNRFFALHYLLPFILVALVLMHLIALHDTAGFCKYYPLITRTSTRYCTLSEGKLNSQNSTSRLQPDLNNFYEWFCGLADAESSFFFRVRSNIVEFEFKIALHKDDLPVLLYIKETLGIGKIDISGKTAAFRVGRHDELLTIFPPRKLAGRGDIWKFSP